MGLLVCVFIGIREYCPAASSLTSRQTLMPERDQPHFHVDESRPHGEPVSFLEGISGRITRAESRRFAEDAGLAFACALGRLFAVNGGTKCGKVLLFIIFVVLSSKTRMWVCRSVSAENAVENVFDGI